MALVAGLISMGATLAVVAVRGDDAPTREHPIDAATAFADALHERDGSAIRDLVQPDVDGGANGEIDSVVGRWGGKIAPALLSIDDHGGRFEGGGKHETVTLTSPEFPSFRIRLPMVYVRGEWFLTAYPDERWLDG